LRNATKSIETAPHLYPQPRVAQGLWLRKHGWLRRRWIERRPLNRSGSPLRGIRRRRGDRLRGACRWAWERTLAMALHGGEDYELLFTAPLSAKFLAKIAGVAITAIGRVLPVKKGGPESRC
jgi:thiamine-monophosphate kinase